MLDEKGWRGTISRTPLPLSGRIDSHCELTPAVVPVRTSFCRNRADNFPALSAAGSGNRRSGGLRLVSSMRCCWAVRAFSRARPASSDKLWVAAGDATPVAVGLGEGHSSEPITRSSPASSIILRAALSSLGEEYASLVFTNVFTRVFGRRLGLLGGAFIIRSRLPQNARRWIFELPEPCRRWSAGDGERGRILTSRAS
jgi:hypothetical protein